MKQFARPLPFAALALATAVSACATATGGGSPTASSGARPASAEDCAVISMALELFPRPADGSPLKVSDIALPVQPSFRPQRPEQRGHEPLSLKNCQAIHVAFVSEGAAVVLSRPEIHDASVFVRYREGDYAPVFAELERTADGHWRHIAAYPTAN